jgi:ATP-dependent DNA helicase RecQ
VSLSDPESILAEYFGHREFRGPQGDIIRRTIDGNHSLVIMPTGMGKSLCFQIPALILAKRVRPESRIPLTVVLSPLIALMKDQVDALKQRGIAATFINSSLLATQRNTRYQEIASGKHDLLYVTPERFRKPDFLEVLRNREIVLLAVDEAHCISQWGHDFRPDYSRLRELRATMENPTTIALTATATPEVQQDIIRQLGLVETEIELFHEGIDRPNLRLQVKEVWGEQEKLSEILRVRRDFPGSGIVYFTLIKTLIRFSELLQDHGIEHVIYHGELDRQRRRSLQDRFMQDNGLLVLATNAFGMGIDKEDIRFVVHADIPGSLESYYQEIGRAGRDGLAAECLLLYDEADLATQMEFLSWSNPNAEFYRRVFDLLLHEQESLQAFGIDWLREKLHHKHQHDRRLETAISMLERYGVIEWNDNGPRQMAPLPIAHELPDELNDDELLNAKLLRDQTKLYALVQYVRCETDRQEFLRHYFGLTR